MRQMIYSKYANERNRSFAIITQIFQEENGSRQVCKSNLYPEGRDHIEWMYQSSLQLDKLYEGSTLLVNKGELKEDGLWLEYLEGETMSDRLDTYLERQEKEKILEDLQGYLDILAQVHQGQAFEMTSDFVQVFGKVGLSADYQCAPVSNIDMVCENLFAQGDKWAVIDGEWTFAFPIPAKYLQYRVIRYYLESNPYRKELIGEDLYQWAHINEQEQQIFDKMEKNFQKYISKDHVPMREMYRHISPGTVPVQAMVQNELVRRSQQRVQVFFSLGEGYTEENSVVLPTYHGKIACEIPLPEGTQEIRLDPGDSVGICKVRKLCYDTNQQPKLQPGPNVLLRGNTWALCQQDPYVFLGKVPQGAKKLLLELHMRMVQPEDVELFQIQHKAHINKTKWKSIGSGSKAVGKTNDKTNDKTSDRAAAQTDSKFADDTVDSGDTNQHSLGGESKAPALKCYVDRISSSATAAMITGWVVDAANNNQVQIQDEHGNPLSAEITRLSRPDVVALFEMDKKSKPGFEVCVKLDEIPGNAIVLIATAESGRTKRIRITKKRMLEGTSLKDKVIKTLRFCKRQPVGQILKKQGPSGFMKILREQVDGDSYDYNKWFQNHRVTDKELERQRSHKFAYTPKFSIIIPLYNTPLNYLGELMDTICGQSYGNWELCLADGSTTDEVGAFIKEHYGKDTRVRYQLLEKNDGIAGNTNAAADMATGDYVMLCDHDDLLEKDALFEMVKALNEDQEIDILYTDEDLTNRLTSEFYSPRFKPDFNLDFLRSINYICHIFVVRKSILDQVGCFRKEMDGAQDFDLILRCCEQSKKIHHIPKILYHWRAHENSTAGNPDSKRYAIEAAKRALMQHYERVGIDAKVEETDIFIMLKTIMAVKGDPKVSIIICNKDHTDDLDVCIQSILQKSTWSNYEIIVVENNSTEDATFAYYDMIQKEHPQIKVVTWDGPFNYSAINNFGAKYATGEYFILLNNDTEVITPDWMEQMLGQCQREEVGIVGAKLYYPDDTVQHCGIVIGMGGMAGHILTHSKRSIDGYFGRLKAIQDISAVTAACLMIKKSTFEAVGGLDENFAVAMNDVDLCLKVRDLGQLIVLNPWVELYHYESKSRGFEDTPEKYERFKKEVAKFRRKWKQVLEAGDPYYNPNLSLMRGDCSCKSPYEHFDIVQEIEREGL